MDSTCTDETTSDSISVSPTTILASPVKNSPVKRLCQVGSGASSTVLDSEGGVEAESRKLPSSQYKGVVPQPNGRWGAQIYEKHQRVWLGTFNEEQEAAKAYDIAAQRFRGRDAVTNFKPLSNEDDIEMAFLSSHSKAEIVDMLRKHTYSDELEQSRHNYGGRRNVKGELLGSTGSGLDWGVKIREPLFEKAVTPSDVGKLNRLVIPKQHAEKHFPLQIGSSSSKGVLLNFEDKGGKVWRFRYSYWNSSQSYVLTKGWSRFVKEKSLKAGDIVGFQRSIGPDKQLYIDCRPRNESGGPGSMVLNHNVNPVQPVHVFRLFGVNIVEKPVSSAMDCGNSNGKRMREVDLFSLECSKKQGVVGAL